MLELNENNLPFLSESFSSTDLLEADAPGEGLTEAFSPVVQLVEAASKVPSGCIGYVEGVAAKTGIINRNRRFYSHEVFKVAVKAANELIKTGQFLGEVDHPWGGTLRGAAVRFTKLWIEGDLVKYEGGILDTGHGQHLKKLLEGGVGVMVSTRGYGSAVTELRKIGGIEVPISVIQGDFRLEGIDFVLFPSNPAGKVTKHEQDNSNHPKEKQIMDLETLRKEHPELVAQVEAAAREGYVTEADRDAAVETARTEARAEALESDEVKALKTVVSSVTEALRPLVPELQKEAETVEKSEAEKAVEALTTQVAALTEKLAAADTAREEAEAQAQKAEAQAARKAVIDGLLEGYEHAELVRAELEALESEDAIRSTFESRKSFIEAVIARGGVAPKAGDAGTGTADKKDEETSPEVKDAIKEQQARLAGSIK